MLEVHQIVPDPEELLALEVPEVAMVLLRHLDSREDMTTFGMRKSTVFDARANPAFAYSRADESAGRYTDKLTKLLEKSWDWLLEKNLLVLIKGCNSSETVCISARGRKTLDEGTWALIDCSKFCRSQCSPQQSLILLLLR